MQIFNFNLNALSSFHCCCTSKLWLLQLQGTVGNVQEGSKGQMLVGRDQESLRDIMKDFFTVAISILWKAFLFGYFCHLLKATVLSSFELEAKWFPGGHTWFLSWTISLLLGALLFRWSSMICASARRTFVLFKSFFSLFSVSTSLWLTWITNHSSVVITITHDHLASI